MGEDGTQDPLDQHMLVLVELQTFPEHLRSLPFLVGFVLYDL